MRNHQKCYEYENVESRSLNREKYKELNRRISEKLHELYGCQLPESVVRRLEEEYIQLDVDGMDHVFYILMKAIDALKKERIPSGEILHRSDISASFIAWLLGITSINPMPAHYRCRKCSYSDFDVPSAFRIGIDLPDRKCPVCGENLCKDGFNIPSISFFGNDGKGKNEISVSVSDPDAMLECLCREIPRKCRCLDSFGYAGESEQLAEYMAADSKHLIFTMKDDEIRNYTGIFEYNGFDLSEKRGWDIRGPVKTIHIAKHPVAVRLEQLTEVTGIESATIPLYDRNVTEILISHIREGACAGLGDFESGTYIGGSDQEPYCFQELFARCDVRNVDDLMRVSALVHGTGTMGTAIDQLNQGVPFRSIPANREDVTEELKRLTDNSEAYRLSEHIRKGRGMQLKGTDKDICSNIQAYLTNGQIRYMHTRAITAERVFHALQLAYYAVFYHEDYQGIIDFHGIKGDERNQSNK